MRERTELVAIVMVVLTVIFLVILTLLRYTYTKEFDELILSLFSVIQWLIFGFLGLSSFLIMAVIAVTMLLVAGIETQPVEWSTDYADCTDYTKGNKLSADFVDCTDGELFAEGDDGTEEGELSDYTDRDVKSYQTKRAKIKIIYNGK